MLKEPDAMPLYHETLIVPAGTLKINAVKVDIKIEQRTIILAGVKFPDGCHDRVHIAGYYGIKQLFPYHSEESIRGSGETVSTLEWWESRVVPWTLTVKGWSPGTSYSHRILIRVITLPDAFETPVKLLSRILEKLDIWLWRIFRI